MPVLGVTFCSPATASCAAARHLSPFRRAHASRMATFERSLSSQSQSASHPSFGRHRCRHVDRGRWRGAVGRPGAKRARNVLRSSVSHVITLCDATHECFRETLEGCAHLRSSPPERPERARIESQLSQAIEPASVYSNLRPERSFAGPTTTSLHLTLHAPRGWAISALLELSISHRARARRVLACPRLVCTWHSYSTESERKERKKDRTQHRTIGTAGKSSRGHATHSQARGIFRRPRSLTT